MAHRSRAVLLLHGLCGSSLELDAFAKALREHGFKVVTPRLAGYSAPETDTTLDNTQPSFLRWIAAAATEIDRLTATHAEVNLCGVSLGATLALAVAAERSTKLDALSLISTTLFFDGWNASRWRFLLPLVYFTPLGHLYRYRETPPYGVKNERVRTWLAAEVKRRYLSSAGASGTSTKSLLEAERLIRHVTASLPRIRTPTLMIHSREDDAASLANVRFVRKHIGANIVTEIIVENSYHMITLDNDCAYAAAKTIHFFDTVAKRRTEDALAASQWAGHMERHPRNAEGNHSS